MLHLDLRAVLNRLAPLPADGWVVPSNANTFRRWYARAAKLLYGNLVALLDGVADQVEINACNAALAAAGGGTVQFDPGLVSISASIVPVAGVYDHIPLGCTVRWDGAAGGTMFENAQATAMFEGGVHGDGIIDLHSLAGVAFNLHSPQRGKWGGFRFANGTATCSLWQLRGDALAVGGSPVGNVNPQNNRFGRVWSDLCGYVYEFWGSNGVPNGYVTLNDFDEVEGHDVRICAYRFVQWTDNNAFHGIHRVAGQADNWRGIIWNDTATPNVNAGVDANIFEHFAADTFGAAWATFARRDDGGAFTDYTAAAGTRFSYEDVLPMRAAPVLNDAWYLGHTGKFSTAVHYITVPGVGNYAITWEYWNGGAWAAIPGAVDDTAGYTVGGYKAVHFAQPANWQTTSVNGSAQLYFIRGRVSAFVALTTQPKVTFVRLGPYYDRVHVLENAAYGNIVRAMYESGNLPEGEIVRRPYPNSSSGIYELSRLDDGVFTNRPWLMGHKLNNFPDFDMNGLGQEAPASFFGDELHSLGIGGTGIGRNPYYRLDSGDFVWYDRANNTWNYVVGNLAVVSIGFSGSVYFTHGNGRSQLRNFLRVLAKRTVTGVVPNPVQNTYGAATDIAAVANHYGFMAPRYLSLTSGGVFGAETLTVRLTVTYSDATTSTITKTFVAAGVETELTGLELHTLFTDGKAVQKLSVDCQSTINNSTATGGAKFLGWNT